MCGCPFAQVKHQHTEEWRNVPAKIQEEDGGKAAQMDFNIRKKKSTKHFGVPIQSDWTAKYMHCATDAATDSDRAPASGPLTNLD